MKIKFHKMFAPLLALWCSVVLINPTIAQSPPAKRQQKQLRRKPSKFGIHSPAVLKVFSSIIKNVRPSTVQIKCDGRDVLLGTIVGTDGWILTKASDLKGKIRCRLADGREMNAKLIGVHKKTDLAMLKVNTKNLIAVHWDKVTIPQVGQWVATVGLQETPVSIGVVSVNPRPIASQSGILGVGLDESKEGPKVNQVMKRSGAEKAGIKKGDLILEVNGKVAINRAKLIAMVREYSPGAILNIKIKRAGKELTIIATLGTRPQSSRSIMQNTMGGPLSKRRKNFPKALQHDTILKPTQCGGPLVDIDGNVIGINIARSGRVESLALTYDVFRHLIPDFKAGKFALPIPTLAEKLLIAEKKLYTALTLQQDEGKASEKSSAAIMKIREQGKKSRADLKKNYEESLKKSQEEEKKAITAYEQKLKKTQKARAAALLKAIKDVQKELNLLKKEDSENNK